MAHGTGLDTLATLVDVDDAVQLTREIVRIPSVVGEEAELSDFLCRRMSTMGFDRVYQQEALAGRANVIGVADSGRPGPTLVLTGHIDTKPVCHGWDSDPYSGALADGKIHGHAVMDMKASVACLIEAGATLARSGRAGAARCSSPASSTTWATSRALFASSSSTGRLPHPRRAHRSRDLSRSSRTSVLGHHVDRTLGTRAIAISPSTRSRRWCR